MTLTPHDNAHSAPIPPLRAEIVLAPETVMAVAQEIARLIIGFLQRLLQEAQAAQDRSLMTPEEVAQYFQVNRQWVYERTSKNEIPHRKVGKYLRFDWPEIERWAAGNGSPGGKSTLRDDPWLANRQQPPPSEADHIARQGDRGKPVARVNNPRRREVMVREK